MTSIEASSLDPKLVDRTRNEVSRAVVALIREEPFFGHLLASVNRDISTRTPTASVSFRGGRPLLSVNPEFYMSTITRQKERVAIMKHEVLHLIFDHVGRLDLSRQDGRIYNLAADLVVNQFVGKKWPLPEGAILLDSFDFDLPPDQTVDWYYDKLMEHAVEIPAGLFASQCDHGGWTEDDITATGAAGSIGRHELARLIRNARDRSGKDWGSVPGEIRQLIDVWIEALEPTVDWRRVLRMFSNSSRRTRIANTLRRPSKRYGTYPGIKVKRFHRLAVIIDTSGSVDGDMLAEFFAEIHAIWKQGSEVTIIESDAAVQRTYDYAGEVPEAVAGRGGTAFDPALQWVADATRPYDAAIYLTDGHAPSPKVLPRCKVLWVVHEDGSDEHLSGHRVVRITK